MMAERRSGTFVRTNFLLSILCFVMVLYSTFLTRSGVLGETSVHSFVDPGNWAYWLLLAVIFVFGVFGFGLLLRRMRQMPRVPVEHSIFSIGLLIAGIRDIPYVLFSFAASFALFVNLSVGYRIFRGNPKYAGGAIAHIGLALLFLGFVASSRYDEKQTVSLEEGKPVDVLGGYKLTYLGNRPLDAERYGFSVEVNHENETYMVMPIIRYSSFTNSMMRH